MIGSPNRPRTYGNACYGGVCCTCHKNHADESCCVHDACDVMHPDRRSERCAKRYDHRAEHESLGGCRWTRSRPEEEEEAHVEDRDWME